MLRSSSLNLLDWVWRRQPQMRSCSGSLKRLLAERYNGMSKASSGWLLFMLERVSSKCIKQQLPFETLLYVFRPADFWGGFLQIVLIASLSSSSKMNGPNAMKSNMNPNLYTNVFYRSLLDGCCASNSINNSPFCDLIWEFRSNNGLNCTFPLPKVTWTSRQSKLGKITPFFYSNVTAARQSPKTCFIAFSGR